MSRVLGLSRDLRRLHIHELGVGGVPEAENYPISGDLALSA